MADLKITEMTVATEMNNADILPIVAAAANFSISKTLFLTGAPGEDIVIQGATGQHAALQGTDIQTIVHCTDDAVGISAEATVVISVATPASNNSINVDDSAIYLLAGTDATIYLASQGLSAGSTIMNFAADVMSITGWGTVNYQLTGLTAADWATSVPATLTIAMNRMSAKVKALNGGVAIP